MKKIWALITGLAAFWVSATPLYIETISSSGSSSSVAAAMVPGLEYVLQCTQEVRYRTCQTSACTATTDDLLLPLGAAVAIPMPSAIYSGVDHTWLAIIPTSAVSTSCRVYRNNPRSIPLGN